MLSRGDTDVSTNEENNNDNGDIDAIARHEEVEYDKKIKDKEEGPYSRGDRLSNRRSDSASLTKDKLSKSNSSFSLGDPRRQLTKELGETEDNSLSKEGRAALTDLNK